MTDGDIRRCDIKIVFTDRSGFDFCFPINLLDREISHFEADGVRYLRQREHEESWEWLNDE